jgi:hypothetical protein
MFANSHSTLELAIKTVIIPIYVIRELYTGSGPTISTVSSVLTADSIERMPSTSGMTFLSWQ